MALASCGSIPQVSGANRVSIGVSVNDVNARVDVNKTVTPAEVDDNGNVTTPASVKWEPGSAGQTAFTFMSRPGSDAAYLTGYRILEDRVGGVLQPVGQAVDNHLNLYVGSGFNCASRTPTRPYDSCAPSDPSMVPANGMPSETLYMDLSSSLINEVIARDSTVGRSVKIEFFGYSSNGAPVTVLAEGIVSVGVKVEK